MIAALTATVTALLPWNTPTASGPSMQGIPATVTAMATALFTQNQNGTPEQGADPTTVVALLTITGNSLAAPVTVMQRISAADAVTYQPGTTVELTFGTPTAPVAPTQTATPPATASTAAPAAQAAP